MEEEQWLPNLASFRFDPIQNFPDRNSTMDYSDQSSTVVTHPAKENGSLVEVHLKK